MPRLGKGVLGPEGSRPWVFWSAWEVCFILHGLSSLPLLTIQPPSGLSGAELFLGAPGSESSGTHLVPLGGPVSCRKYDKEILTCHAWPPHSPASTLVLHVGVSNMLQASNFVSPSKSKVSCCSLNATVYPWLGGDVDWRVKHQLYRHMARNAALRGTANSEWG